MITKIVKKIGWGIFHLTFPFTFVILVPYYKSEEENKYCSGKPQRVAGLLRGAEESCQEYISELPVEIRFVGE